VKVKAAVVVVVLEIEVGKEVEAEDKIYVQVYRRERERQREKRNEPVALGFESGDVLNALMVQLLRALTFHFQKIHAHARGVQSHSPVLEIRPVQTRHR
jgi:hypothetical protein